MRQISRPVLGLCLFAIGVTGLIVLFVFAEQAPEGQLIIAGIVSAVGAAIFFSDPPPVTKRRKRDWGAIGGTVITVLGWLWLVATNVFYVIVVLYVFSALSNKTEHILVSILGLIYVGMRGQALASNITLSKLALGLDDEFTRIRTLLHDESVSAHSEEIAAVREKAERNYLKIGVNSIFLSIIGLICLLSLFMNLGKY
jgi:hypothetical protein